MPLQCLVSVDPLSRSPENDQKCSMNNRATKKDNSLLMDSGEKKKGFLLQSSAKIWTKRSLLYLKLGSDLLLRDYEPGLRLLGTIKVCFPGFDLSAARPSSVPLPCCPAVDPSPQTFHQ
ncbi:hypothetical protein D4764_09G0000010, partial [Takifugu flavidus]